jgi:hypothetical protein
MLLHGNGATLLVRTEEIKVHWFHRVWEYYSTKGSAEEPPVPVMKVVGSYRSL